jgi:hypothetical protein
MEQKKKDFNTKITKITKKDKERCRPASVAA